MKEFDYEKARAGAPVCTRDGRPVRIICFDRKHPSHPIVAICDDVDIECVFTATKDGMYYIKEDSRFDLMMATIKYEGWVNVYRREDGSISIGEYYGTKADAIEGKTISSYSKRKFVATAKIEWEE